MEIYDTQNSNFIHYFDFIINYISNIILVIYNKIDNQINNADYHIQNLISKIYTKNIDIDTKLYLIKISLETILKIYNPNIKITQILNLIEIALENTFIYINSKNNINRNLITNYFKKQIKKILKNQPTNLV